jgi:hypothetical protein
MLRRHHQHSREILAPFFGLLTRGIEPRNSAVEVERLPAPEAFVRLNVRGRWRVSHPLHGNAARACTDEYAFGPAMLFGFRENGAHRKIFSDAGAILFLIATRGFVIQGLSESA